MSDAQDIINLANENALNAGASIAMVDLTADGATADGLLSLFRPQGMAHEVLDLEKHLPHPRRARGTVRLHDVDSVIAYVKKHGWPNPNGPTAIYADIDGPSVTAVLNGHDENTDDGTTQAGWGDHRAVLTLKLSPQWKLWTASDRKGLGQLAFANLVHDGLDDIVEPSGAELAQTLQVNNKVAFRSQQLLANGQRQFTFETLESKAGAKGTLTIPNQFTLALAPFEGCPTLYKVTARLRFRLDDTALIITYLLDRPDDVLRAAFADVADAVGSGTGITPYRGAAPLPLQ